MLSGAGRNDTIGGNGGNDTLAGDGGNDLLFGGPVEDLLKGGDGKDSLDGGSGNDTMTGGTGADQFLFTTQDAPSGGAHLDEIVDFSHAQKDKIDLSAIDAISGGFNDAFNFSNMGAFTGSRGNSIRWQSPAE